MSLSLLEEALAELEIQSRGLQKPLHLMLRQYLVIIFSKKVKNLRQFQIRTQYVQHQMYMIYDHAFSQQQSFFPL